MDSDCRHGGVRNYEAESKKRRLVLRRGQDFTVEGPVIIQNDCGRFDPSRWVLPTNVSLYLVRDAPTVLLSGNEARPRLDGSQN